MNLSAKERSLLTPFGWSITCGRDPIVLDSSAVGNDLLFIIEGSICARGQTLGGTERFSTFQAGQLIGRDFFNCGQPSLRIMPGSVCMLLTQESLDHMIREQPKLAAKLYRGFAVALVQHLTGYQPPQQSPAEASALRNLQTA
jgi:hypothetical protein